MEVIPAIDIRDRKCVRLFQGDYQRETVYSESPADVAARWVSMGASRLHVVDLDGARAGAPVNMGVVGGIASSVAAPIQFGGGIRTLEAAKEAVSLGVGRIIMGTAAAEDPVLVRQACRELDAETVLVSVDARDGYVAVWGWTRKSQSTAAELVKQVEAMGVRRFVYTDVTRDGTLTEPNFGAIEGLVDQTEMKMLVAGGISSVDHLRRLSQLGVEAGIVGKAVFTGDINLRDAIEAVSGSGQYAT